MPQIAADNYFSAEHSSSSFIVSRHRTVCRDCAVSRCCTVSRGCTVCRHGTAPRRCTVSLHCTASRRCFLLHWAGADCVLPRCVSGRCVIRHQTVFDSIVPYRLIQGWAEQSPSAISEPTQPHRSKAFGQWTASVALRRNRLQASRRAQIESEPRQGFIPCIVRTSVSCAGNTSLPCRSSRLGTKVLKRRVSCRAIWNNHPNTLLVCTIHLLISWRYGKLQE